MLTVVRGVVFIRILFMGTPDFAAGCLRVLADLGEEIVGVMTRQDKPKGRGMKLVCSPVKQLALEKGFPIYQPSTLKNDAVKELLEELNPELIIVAAYGMILPKYVLDFPKYGCINAHASILPEYRGASPIQRAIMDGKEETGITAMYMNEGLDTGDIILTEKVKIELSDNFETLHDKLTNAGGRALVRVIEGIKNDSLTRSAQDDSKACYAEKITKADCLINFDKPALCVYNMIRALSPVPLSYTKTENGQIIKIVASALSDKAIGNAVPGEVVSLENDAVTVACRDGCIDILTLLPEGKGRRSAADYIRGRNINVGDRLLLN